MNLFNLMATISLDDSKYQQGINKAEKSTMSLGSTIKKLAIGGAVAGIGKASITMGMDFEASMSQVAATMGMTSEQIKNGDESFKALEKAAKEAGSTTQFSATQSAEALNYLALAGYDAETSVKMLPKVLNLAAAGGMDLGRASDMVTDSMSALGLETSQADKFIDEMAKTSQKSNTTVSQLGDAILTVGGTAKVLAGGTVEMNTQLGILADNGIKGAEGGTALRNIILSLSAPTDKAAESIKKLGVDVFDSSGKMRETNVIFAEMNKALGKLTQEEKTQALNNIFNKVDLKSVNALLDNSGDRFNDLSKEVENSKDAAKNMAETMNTNLQGSLTTLKSSLEGLGIAIFEKFKEPITNAVNTVVELFQSFITVLESGKIDWLLALIAAGLSAVITQMVIMKGIAIVSTIASFVKMIFSAATMVKSFSGAMAILNAVMMANPIGIVVGLIGLLVGAFVYLWNTSDGFREAIINSWQWIKDKAFEIWGKICNFFTITVPNAIKTMNEWFRSLPSKISTWLTETLAKVRQWASDMRSKSKEMAINFVNSVIEWFKQLPSKVATWFNGVVQKATELKSKMISKAKEIGSNFATWLINGVKSLPSKFANIGKDIVSGVWNGIKSMGNWFKERIGGFFGGMINGVKKLFGINSPSRVFRDEVGKWIPAGVAVGIEDNMKPLEDTLDRELGATIDIAKPNVPKIGHNKQENVKIELRIDNFYNNSKEDIQHIADELAYMIERKRYATGGR